MALMKASLTKFALLLAFSLAFLVPGFGQNPSGRPTETPPTKPRKPPRKPPVKPEPQPATVTLTVLTDPPESAVLINGEARGVSNAEGKMHVDKLPLGHYSVEVRKDGFNPMLRGFQAGAESPTLVFKLEPNFDAYVQQFDALTAQGKLAGPDSPNALELVTNLSNKFPERPEVVKMRGLLATKLMESVTPVINKSATNWRAVTREELATALNTTSNALTLKQDDTRMQAEAAYLRGALALKEWQSANQAQADGKSSASLVTARTEFANALRVDEAFAPARLQLGMALKAAGEWAGAEATLMRATQLEPRWAHAHLALGEVYYAQGKHREAIDAYRRALEIDPSSARALSGLGLARAMRGEKDGIKDIERAIQLDAKSALPHLQLGIVLSQSKGKKDRQRAEDEFKKAIELNASTNEFSTRGAEQLLADLKKKK